MLKKCKKCNKEFETKGPRKFCSDKCFKEHRKEYKKNRYKKICEWCGKEYKASKKSQKFCSTVCQYDRQKKDKKYKKELEKKLSMNTRIEREGEFKKRFENKFLDFEYHSGYINTESYFKMKCKICGNIQDKHADCIRPSRSKELICNSCEEARLNKKKKKEFINKIINLIKENIEQVKRVKVYPRVEEIRRIKRNHRYYIKCDKCGKGFFTNRKDMVHCNHCIKETEEEERIRRSKWEGKTIECKECSNEFEMKSIKSKYCSAECQDKFLYRKKEIRKREKLLKNGKVNLDISLDKLIERDEGVCMLCGEEVNKDDYIVTDEGYFIVGNNYPSIDHIIPVAKGGTHTWDNVQLAHHHCNSIKSDNIIN